MAEGIALDAYVKETLLSIVKAVIAAQDDADCGGFIGRAAYGAQGPAKDELKNVVTDVSFDLATTVEDRGTAGGSAGVKVIPFMKAEVSGQTQSAQSTVSRIAFTVPIAIPRPKAQREEDQRREADRQAQDRRNNEEIQRLGRDINGDNGMYG
ncbi:hypothetical protein [Brevundimonas sp. KM4]|jgi:hypothetical protein|uniref:hypothetical protein n=1 Tax=Brevundimonas sp. KM4 TaxID=1628191 RepID=UPI0005F83D86|nr:hypothetical protein [Brevundimonas sp. KM4]KJV41607.1 hypothetical protein VH88_07870 [Brevundimonas sp. KM4]